MLTNSIAESIAYADYIDAKVRKYKRWTFDCEADSAGFYEMFVEIFSGKDPGPNPFAEYLNIQPISF